MSFFFYPHQYAWKDPKANLAGSKPPTDALDKQKKDPKWNK